MATRRGAPLRALALLMASALGSGGAVGCGKERGTGCGGRRAAAIADAANASEPRDAGDAEAPCMDPRQVSKPSGTRRAVAEEILRSGVVDVYFDPRKANVIVPPKFRQGARLILRIGYALPVPIEDLKIDDAGFSGTLSFDRTPFFCKVPWSTVFALVAENGTGAVWADATPAEFLCDASAP